MFHIFSVYPGKPIRTSMEGPQNSVNTLKISAKTSARIRVRKALRHHEFSHVWRSTWNSARLFAEGLFRSAHAYCYFLPKNYDRSI